MILLDVAMGPVYAMMGGTLLLVLGIVALCVFGAVKLIKKATKKDEEE
ncbi:MAG: hypothetical protein IJ306_00540 [Oscillospiraceae bacterium]|nr:hypothetical protein [Oscillospiraceae bacterium]